MFTGQGNGHRKNCRSLSMCMVIGTKEFNRYYCAELVKLGFLVFSVEYPLIPDCMIYDQFESVSRAMDKVQTLIETYQGDAEKIYAVADSGGACLLTYAAAMQNCGALAEAAGVVPTTLPVREPKIGGKRKP